MRIISDLILFSLISTLSLNHIQGQETVTTSGGDSNGAGGSIAFSVGQVNYSNYEGANGRISLGVQQPLNVNMVGTDDPEWKIDVSVFPNPVKNTVQIKMDRSTLQLPNQAYRYQLYDIHGKKLEDHSIDAEVSFLLMQSFPNGMYLLRIDENNVPVRSFKIFKTN